MRSLQASSNNSCATVKRDSISGRICVCDTVSAVVGQLRSRQ